MISHFWDRPVPIFSDVRFPYLALVQDKKITCVLPANACCTVYVNCPPILLWNTFKILPRHGCIWINRIFTLAMEKKLPENARWNVNKTIRCLVRNKIKHRKKCKIGKSPTPLVRFQSFSNSASLVRERLKSYPRVSEIFLSCTPPGVRFYIS